jgi:hypothetical protein
MADQFSWHFIEDEAVVATIETLVAIAGSNFVPPYDSSAQPSIVSDLNNEPLLQFDLPAGMSARPYADSMATHIGNAINSLMVILAPIMSAFGMMMPIIQVIIGIMEVLCALMNPFAVARAIKRLLRTYLPRLLALFPPLAGVIILLNILKMVLAIVLFIMTVVIPTIQLVIANAKLLATLVHTKAGTPPDTAKAQHAAAKRKIDALIVELLNQMGVFKAFLPLFDLIMSILGMKLKFPCKGSKDGSSGDCCSEDVCPPILTNPPSGRAVLIPVSYGDLAPYFAFSIRTHNTDIGLLAQYNQSLAEQLSAQLDEPVDSCCPAGSPDGGCPNFTVKVTGRRGVTQTISAPVVKISDTDLLVVNPDLLSLIGTVSYEVVPNFEMLVAHQVISIGCDPDVAAARFEIIEKFPSIGDSPSFPLPDFHAADAALVAQLAQLQADPYNPDNAQVVQDGLMGILNALAADIRSSLRGISSDAINLNASTIDTDKTVARSDYADLITVTVTPRDGAGNPILRNLPADVLPDVEVFSTLGDVSNKRFDGKLGAFLFDLKSHLTGPANITATINGGFVSDAVNGAQITRNVPVSFVADSVLPTRRRTVAVAEKEPRRS